MGMQGAWDPATVGPSPAQDTRDPREGSAAWRAEQIATGQMPIPISRPTSFGAATPPQTQTSIDPTPLIFGLVKLGIVIAIGVFVWFQFFHSTAPSADEISDAFVPVAGYEYGSDDSPVAAAVEGFVMSYPGFEDEISDFEVREVSAGTMPVGVVMIGGFEYSEDKQADFEAGAQADNVSEVSLGLPGKTFTAYEASVPDGHVVVWIDEDGFLFAVATRYPAHSHKIATALGAAAL